MNIFMRWFLLRLTVDSISLLQQQLLRQDDINDLPIYQTISLHLDSKRITFNLTADSKAINAAIAQCWLIAIRTLRCLLLQFRRLLLHDLLHLVFDYCIDVTALND